MKKIFNRYYSVLLLLSLFAVQGSRAQCNATPDRPYVFFGVPQPGTFKQCPYWIPKAKGGVYAYISIDNNELCDQVVKGNNVIYWPKNKRMDWKIIHEQEQARVNLCDKGSFYQTNGSSYSNESAPRPFIPTTTGLYQIGGKVYITAPGVKEKKIKVWLVGEVTILVPDACPNPSGSIYKFNDFLSLNICVVDCGPVVNINISPCGDNILHRPANTADYEYFWQTSEFGEDMTYGGETFTIKASGYYYLRGRHKATGMWGQASKTYATYNSGPVLATPPVPTVTGNVCGNVTLTMPAAPAGVTYYWQENGCADPASTDKPANIPYTNIIPGKTYYVRAYRSNDECWSACSAVTPTVNAIAPPSVSGNYACACDNINPATGKPNVTLTAIPSQYANTCRWYQVVMIGSTPTFQLIQTGTTLIVNTDGSEVYYVSSFNTSTLCESTMIPVKVKLKSCGDCQDDFSPVPGKEYVISAWIKEPQNTFDAVTYTNASIIVEFVGPSGPTSKTFKASGEIIEGWQKIEEAFTIPTTTENIKIQLNNGGASGDVFFDDIRFFPFKSNMVSYVYDFATLKLVAELDANNYATYYVYDDEGKLTKVKKETTGGIKTVKEGRASNVINNN